MRHTTTLLIIILMSINCMAQWDNIFIDSTYYELRDLNFINKDSGFACGYIMHGEGAILRTYDGGENWQNTISDIMVCSSIDFVSDYIGFVVGNSAIFKTIDQGANWLQQNADSIYYYRAIYMIDKFEGYTVGNEGVLAHTIDGGAYWTSDSITDKDLLDIVFIKDSIGFIIGNGGDTFSKMKFFQI